MNRSSVHTVDRTQSNRNSRYRPSLQIPRLLVGTIAMLSLSAFGQADLKIAFLSCIDQTKPKETIWESLLKEQPDSVIFMGDNVYADTPEFRESPNLEIAKREYQNLNQIEQFKELEKTAKFHVTWDDHDYLLSDAGVENPLKEEGQKLFNEFWRIPLESKRGQREGVYGADWVHKDDYQAQVILLDTRYFRSKIKLDPPTVSCPLRNYVATDDVDATMLGPAQWDWLESRLQKDADLHILVSSIQVIPDEHCWEKWGNMPLERERLIQLISQASAPVVIVSGDRHLADVSKLNPGPENSLKRPLIEATSSPFSARSGFGRGDPNSHRAIDDNIRQSNFGVLNIDTKTKRVTVAIKGSDGSDLTLLTLD